MAQKKQADSLKNALKITTNDAGRCEVLFQLGDYYLNTNRDTSLYYFNKAQLVANSNKQALTEALTLSDKAYVLMFLKKYPESFSCIQQALKLAEKPESEKGIWDVLGLLRKRWKTPHQQRIGVLADIHATYGGLMGNTHNPEQQIFQYHKALKFASEFKDFRLLGSLNMNFGGLYNRLNRLDSAMVMEKNAERQLKLAGYTGIMGGVYYRIGEIYLKMGSTALGLKYLQKGLNTAIKENVAPEINAACSDLTDYYLKTRQKDSSLFYARKTLDALRSVGSKSLDQAYQKLYRSFKLAGNTDSTYKYQGLALMATDSVYKATVKSLTDFQKLSFKATLEVQALEKEKEASQTKVRTFVLLAAIGVLMLLAGIFYRNYRQKQKANNVLESTLNNLKTTQTQLIQSEKMASLGELTAGIAHEIQNPLNFVNNFSEVNQEMLQELKAESEKPKAERNAHLEVELMNDLIENEKKISQHGKRADAIVKGMLEHSRSNSGQKEPTDINALADEYLRLAYHGLRAKDKNFNAELVTNFAENLPKVNVIPQDFGRVLLNLFNNAFYAVNQKKKTVAMHSFGAGDDYKPEVEVSTSVDKTGIRISVKDNGNGIPDPIKDKIMQPFFTTKPSGEGTGLGLSLTYDMVVKGHGGSIKMESQEGEGSEFIITLSII